MLNCLTFQVHTGEEMKRINSFREFTAFLFLKRKCLMIILYFLKKLRKEITGSLVKQLDLFSTHEEAGAGLIYWHPKGARVRLEIEDFWRKAHLENGYELLYYSSYGKKLALGNKRAFRFL